MTALHMGSRLVLASRMEKNKDERNYNKWQDRQCTYNVILWRVGITILQWQQNNVSCVFCFVSYKKKYFVVKQCFYGEFMSPEKIQAPIFERNKIPTNLHCSHPLNTNIEVKRRSLVSSWLSLEAQSG
jgi:hypothetical protein